MNNYRFLEIVESRMNTPPKTLQEAQTLISDAMIQEVLDAPKLKLRTLVEADKIRAGNAQPLSEIDEGMIDMLSKGYVKRMALNHFSSPNAAERQESAKNLTTEIHGQLKNYGIEHDTDGYINALQVAANDLLLQIVPSHTITDFDRDTIQATNQTAGARAHLLASAKARILTSDRSDTFGRHSGCGPLSEQEKRKLYTDPDSIGGNKGGHSR